MSVQSPSVFPGRGSTVFAAAARCARGASTSQRRAASSFHGIVTANPPAGRPASSRHVSPSGRSSESSSATSSTCSGTNRLGRPTARYAAACMRGDSEAATGLPSIANSRRGRPPRWPASASISAAVYCPGAAARVASHAA